MKIGILGAMIEEVKLVKELMVIVNESCIANRVFYEGRIGQHDVVLTFSRWGKVASSSTTTTLIDKFGVDFVMFTGVAGAVAPELNIGDVVIGNGFYQHDMDARPFFKQFQVPLTDTILFEPKQEEVSRAMIATQSFLSKIETYISKEILSQYSILKPSVSQGLVASGDKFVADPTVHKDLHYSKGTRTSLAVEMEGAAVAQVCSEHNIPYIVIRTISDKADHSAVIDFKGFVDQIACHYSCGILREYLMLLCDSERSSVNVHSGFVA